MNFGDITNIPLANRIRKRAQRDVALFQDVLIRVIYEIDNTAEIHGGTAIWRCYGGRRFSKDIDVYVSSREKWEELGRRITETAGRYNAKVIKRKDTGNLIFIELLMDDIYSEIDINYKKYYGAPLVKRYENLDGTFYEVLTLPPEVLILEKIDAYNNRKYITDLYDMRVLLDHAKLDAIRPELKAFVSSLNEPAQLKAEESRLQDLVYEGPVPSFKSLVEHMTELVA